LTEPRGPDPHVTRRAEQGEHAPEIPQISVYLLRDVVTDFETALRDPDSLTTYDLDPAAGLEGRLFVLPAEAKRPSWLPFLQSIASEPLAEYANQHVSAVLIVRRSGRMFALTFGFGRFLLDPDVIEPDFGLKVAAGLVDPDQINAVDSRILEATRVQVRRQVSRGTTTQTIGVEIAREILRALSGRTLDGAHGTKVSGSDSLALAGRFDPAAVRDRIDLFSRTYAEKAYRRRFPHLDRWQAVTDRGEIARLDHELESAVARQDDKLDLGVPEIVDWRAAGFRFSREPETTNHPFPALPIYLATLGLTSPSLADLKRDRLILISGDIETPASTWPVYRALEWEAILDDHVYVLADGRWWMIDADYLGRIDARLALINHDPLDAPDADPREWEPDYTPRLAEHRANRVVLDRKLARFEDESGTVEYCDVFTGERQFIHLKPDTQAAGVSHLIAQGAVSADLFRNSPSFRHGMRSFLRDRVGRPDLADLIPSAQPGMGEFEVVFALLSGRPDRAATNLPVFSRIHLARMADVIERLDYRLRVVGIARRANARPAALGETIGERRDRERRESLASQQAGDQAVGVRAEPTGPM
jgi:uncharacterized protein (TIGR04141 family)